MTEGRALGLPEGVRGCLFDVDGVITNTAKVHATAWKQMFDDFLRTRAERIGEPFVPFDMKTDYDVFVDGKSRGDGTRSFLESRQVFLPEGNSDDGSEAETICGLGKLKNEIFLGRIRRDGVEAYEGSVSYLRAVCAAGLRRAAVSSSANCAEVLVAAGVDDLFEVRVDGLTIEAEHLAGKPAPDVFLAAARTLGVEPHHTAVFEDSLSGVAAGRSGGFGFVVAIDRVGQAGALHDQGADTVVGDLSELLEQK